MTRISRCLAVALALADALPSQATAQRDTTLRIGMVRPNAPGYPSDMWSQTSLAFNVRDFGAKGDGSTDDTRAIQAALNAAAVCFTPGGCAGYPGISSSAVYLPPGQYGITTTLTVPDHVRLYGAGRVVSEIVALSPGWTNPTPNALVRLGDGTKSVFGTRVETLDINAQGLPNTIDLYSQDVQDESGALHVLLRAFGAAGVQFVGRATGQCPCNPNGYILEDVDAYNGVAGTGIGFDLDGGPGGNTFSPLIFGIRHSNATFTGAYNPAGIRLQRGNYFLHGVVTEFAVHGIQFGGPNGPAGGTVFGVAANHDSAAVVVSNNSTGVSAFSVYNPGGINLFCDLGGLCIPVARQNYLTSFQGGNYSSIVPQVVRWQCTLTYSASIGVQLGGCGTFKITATNGTAFTINNPTGMQNTVAGSNGNNTSEDFTIDLFNNSGGALGVVTVGSNYRLAGGGTRIMPTPATAAHRLYVFHQDGTLFREVSRSAADVPN